MSTAAAPVPSVLLQPRPLAALAATTSFLLGYIASIQPAAALGLVLALVFVVVAFRSLVGGLALFTLVISLEYVPGLTVALVKPAGAVLATAWAAQLLTHRDRTRFLLRDRPLIAVAAFGLAFWAFASSLWAFDSGVAVSIAVRLGQGFLLVFIVYSALRQVRDVRLLLGAYVLGALLAVVVGLATGGTDSGRLAGGVGNPNQLAAVLVPAVMICSFALLAERRPLMRWAIAVTGLVLLLGLLLTGSRGGLIGMAIALTAAIMLAGPGRVAIIAATLVMLGAGVAYYAAVASPGQVQRTLSARAEGGTGREDIWAVAWEAVRDRPLVGSGAGNFTLVAPSYAVGDLNISRVDLVVDKPKVVHNTYLEVLTELGIVGAALFVFLLLGAVAATFSAVRRARAQPWAVQLLVRGFTVGLIGILIVYFFGSREYEKQLWLLLGIAFALPTVVSRALPSEDA
jgi:O-Antigen ligase